MEVVAKRRGGRSQLPQHRHGSPSSEESPDLKREAFAVMTARHPPSSSRGAVRNEHDTIRARPYRGGSNTSRTEAS